MKYKIMTMTAIVVVFIISIQVTVAPEVPPPEEAIDPLLLELLDNKDNLQIVVDVFTTACKNKSKAKDKIQEYKTKGIPSKLEEFLIAISESPLKSYHLLKPILKKLDKKLSKYMCYGVCVKPLWHIVKGLGCMALRAVGFSMFTTGELIQLLNNAAREMSNAAGNTLDANQAQSLDEIHKAGNQLKIIGNSVDDVGRGELAKIQRKAHPNFGNAPSSGYKLGTEDTQNANLQYQRSGDAAD